jgi:hypothetical protein
MFSLVFTNYFCVHSKPPVTYGIGSFQKVQKSKLLTLIQHQIAFAFKLL